MMLSLVNVIKDSAMFSTWTYPTMESMCVCVSEKDRENRFAIISKSNT